MESESLAGVLARVRLNFASVDQFAEIACGLADDNPAIRRDVHEAARETRQAAKLIDHLRSLFAHQHEIELERGTIELGGQQADNLQLFSYSNQQTLARAAKSLVANVAKILYLTDEIVLRGRLEGPDLGDDTNKTVLKTTQSQAANTGSTPSGAASQQPNQVSD